MPYKKETVKGNESSVKPKKWRREKIHSYVQIEDCIEERKVIRLLLMHITRKWNYSTRLL